MLPNTSRLTGDSSCQPTMEGAMPEPAKTAPATTPVASTSWWGLGRGMAASVRRALRPPPDRPRSPLACEEGQAQVGRDLFEDLPAAVDDRAEPEEVVDHPRLTADLGHHLVHVQQL